MSLAVHPSADVRELAARRLLDEYSGQIGVAVGRGDLADARDYLAIARALARPASRLGGEAAGPLAGDHATLSLLYALARIIEDSRGSRCVQA